MAQPLLASPPCLSPKNEMDVLAHLRASVRHDRFKLARAVAEVIRDITSSVSMTGIEPELTTVGNGRLPHCEERPFFP